MGNHYWLSLHVFDRGATSGRPVTSAELPRSAASPIAGRSVPLARFDAARGRNSFGSSLVRCLYRSPALTTLSCLLLTRWWNSSVPWFSCRLCSIFESENLWHL